MIRSLADSRRATPGPCCLCDAPATQWHRTGRHRSDADGLTTAVRCCDAHEQDAATESSATPILVDEDGKPRVKA